MYKGHRSKFSFKQYHKFASNNILNIKTLLRKIALSQLQLNCLNRKLPPPGER